MKQYLDLLARVLDEGTWHDNRTGISTKRITGAMLEFDLALGFPAVTTKKLAFNQVKGELIGFIRGCTNAKDFRELGCTIWDQNANENKAWLANPNRKGTDDLGRIYGVQWRDWDGYWDGLPSGYGIDQLANALHDIQYNPQSRRIIVNAWNPSELNQMALPPCHVLHQYHVDTAKKELSMTMYQRSCDMFLGVPFNIASYALLLHLMARAAGLRPARLVMFLADVHIYENHFDQVAEQLLREPMPLPFLSIENNYGGFRLLASTEPEELKLVNYKHHPPIKGAMAV